MPESENRRGLHIRTAGRSAWIETAAGELPDGSCSYRIRSSRRGLPPSMESFKDKIEAALELEKQARVLLGKERQDCAADPQFKSCHLLAR